MKNNQKIKNKRSPPGVCSAHRSWMATFLSALQIQKLVDKRSIKQNRIAILKRRWQGSRHPGSGGLNAARRRSGILDFWFF